MVDVLRKPPEAGIVGLAGLERSLQPCGLCQALSSQLTPASTWSGWPRRQSCCARPPFLLLSLLYHFLSYSHPVSLLSLYILHQTLCQKMANYGWLVKSGLPPVFVNKVLEHNQVPSFSCL